MSSPNRQTISYLTRRFREVGLEPNRRHGQNFLIDLNLIELLARSAEVDERTVVLEIGTGMGSLTTLVAPLAGAVITVEIDEHLFQLAREELEPFANVQMLHMDVLKNKNHFRPEVLERIREAMAGIPQAELKLVANLPYNVATPILSNLLSCPLVPTSMTVTIQKELGDRIVAAPYTKDYGALSVWIQSQCRAEIVRELPPGVFWPRPKVDSAIVHMVVEPERRSAIPDLTFWHHFLRVMFFHRRKFLRAVAVSGFQDKLSKPQVDEVLQAHQLGPDARTEQLSVEELLALSEGFRQKLLELGLDLAFKF